MNKEEFDAAPAGTIALLTIKDGGTAFELNLGNAVGTNSYLLEYRTTNPGDQTEISNAVSLLVGGEAQKTFDSYRGKDNTATQHTQKQIAIQKAGATIQSDLTGKIKITKYDADDATILLEGVVFVVTKEDDTSISYEITTDSKGVAITPELVPGTYTIVEKKSKAGYILDVNPKRAEMKIDKTPVRLNISNKKDTAVKPVDVTVKAKKELTGKALTDNQFTFELKNGDAVVATATNKADGTITFTPQYFDAEGTFTYTIVEKDDKQANVTYDVTEKQVKVVVTKGDNNQLVATVTYDEAETTPVFTNTYTEPKATPVDVTLKAKKELTGKALVDNQFTFEVKKGDEVVATATNKADGTITFDTQRFDAEGTFTYTISEKNDKQANITYDATVKQVKVVVTKGDNNQLVATVTYDETETIPVFTNTYTEPKATPVDVTLKAKKELTGKALVDNQFTFELKKDNAVIATATNKADGTITFTPQHFDAEGTFIYTISEKNDKQANITYDITEKQVKVVVTKGDNNQLVATVTYDETETIPVFTNTYTEPKATPVDVTLKAKKELTGKVLVDNQFTFELKQGDAVVATATNKADGTITFTPQHFDAEGTFTYTISEKNDKQANITYDATEKQVKVVVTKGDNNQLVATVTYDETETIPVFTNIYTEPKATPVDVTLKAKKELTGKALVDNQFTFELKQGDAVVATATNKADGTITFTPQHFDAEGTFTYTISEKNDKQANITYDATEKQVKVVVTKGDNNQLVATVTYDEAETIPVFTNTYTEPKATPVDVTLKAKKELTGKALTDNQFTFELKNGDAVVATATNKADGTITFDTQRFDVEGTFTYTIVEKDDKQANVTYDITEKQVKVVVTKGDNNQLVATVTYDETETIPVFTNTYTEPKATPVDVTLKAKKELTGKVLVDNQFTFELKKDNAVIATATNKADGTITFTPQHFDAEGTFTYTISEKNDKQANITYDATEKQVKVVVTKGDNNQLVATVTYDETETIPVFTNIYTEPKATPVDVTLKAKKVLENKMLNGQDFMFVLKQNDTVIEQVSNKQDGKISFTPLSFDKVGTYYFVMNEVIGDNANITYDMTQIAITITVTEEAGRLVATVLYNGVSDEPVFVNTYHTPTVPPKELHSSKTMTITTTQSRENEKPVLPKTGTNTILSSILMLVGFSLVLTSGIVYQYRQKS
ncbi:cell surface protein [Granulicatella sp. zg-ZJ]|uniref:Spy0128 family protein n=1 Tax=Granulicatella sp. zg-ZJ TaxID=2678504 RepID=UPI0013D689A3|nr:FctA domain-containing protein [Granulicatella sp. zg-ZJ]NEW62634.1 cell surface protein [Granulicatella sp. zg-ZJ]